MPKPQEKATNADRIMGNYSSPRPKATGYARSPQTFRDGPAHCKVNSIRSKNLSKQKMDY